MYMLRGAVKATAASVVLTALLLQLYFRYYPYIYPTCKWAPNTVHKILAYGDPQITGYLNLQKFRKRVDILGNDRFLAQIAASTRNALKPEYAVVLGDLLSSQWIATPEFDLRVDRYEHIFPLSGPGEVLNISGNHDIGYHGEFSDERLERYIRRFGQLNFVIENEGFRIVGVNCLSLDGPPFDDKPRTETLEFLKGLEGYSGSSVLLTHVPLYKKTGVCRDSPHFSYFENGGNLRGQNHLSLETTNLLLNSVFGSHTSGIVLAGHDHEGCESSYSLTNESWTAHAGIHSGKIKEATVRSIMGEFGGNVGVVSGVRGSESETIRWEYSLCRFHVQHIWWIMQVCTYLSIVALPLAFLA